MVKADKALSVLLAIKEILAGPDLRVLQVQLEMLVLQALQVLEALKAGPGVGAVLALKAEGVGQVQPVLKAQLAIKVLLEILALKVLKVLKVRLPSAARGVTKDLKIMLRLLQAAYKN